MIRGNTWISLILVLLTGMPTSTRADEYAKFLPPSIADKIKNALKSIDFDEHSLLTSANIVFVSAESTAVTGTDITNRIHYFQRDNLDIWLMRQKQTSAEGTDPSRWSLVSIVVDHTDKPAHAYFLEFAATPVSDLPQPIIPRVPCLRCHPNGPRLIRPAHSQSVASLKQVDFSTLAKFNRRIAQAGIINGYSPQLPSGEAMLDDSWPNATAPLLTPKCQQCHDSEKGIRNSLQLQNATSILYLTTHSRDLQGYVVPTRGGLSPDMPLEDLPLTMDESACLQAWFRQKPMPVKCLTGFPVRERSAPTMQRGPTSSSTSVFAIDPNNSSIQARVTTTLNSFSVTGLIPTGSLFCDKEMQRCSGKFAVELAGAMTGIRVRDQHLKKMLRADQFPVASLEIPTAALPMQSMYATSIAGATLSLAGKASHIDLSAKCQLSLNHQSYECSFDKVSCDIHRFGMEPPAFLGIKVAPAVEISGKIIFFREFQNIADIPNKL